MFKNVFNLQLYKSKKWPNAHNGLQAAFGSRWLTFPHLEASLWFLQLPLFVKWPMKTPRSIDCPFKWSKTERNPQHLENQTGWEMEEAKPLARFHNISIKPLSSPTNVNCPASFQRLWKLDSVSFWHVCHREHSDVCVTLRSFGRIV